MNPRNVDLLLLGFGNVGRAFARLIDTKQSELSEEWNLHLRVVGIATGRHGAALNNQGLRPEQALELVESGQSLHELGSTVDGIEHMIAESQADAVLESIPVNYETGEPALSYLRMALENGMHAITANKGPVVHGYSELSQLARERNRRFLFESTVLDGAPVFSTWRSTLPGARLESFRGILNSTTNYILTQMEGGLAFEEAVHNAQELGVAESDPSGDVEGWDAAVKVAAVITVLMGQSLKIEEIDRTGIGGIHATQIAEATAQGKRWKLICTGWREGESVLGRVGPELVESSDPLYQVGGTSSAITFHSDVLGDLTIAKGDSGPETTAYGMLADLLNAVRARR